MSKGARDRNVTGEEEPRPKRLKNPENVESLRMQTDAFFELHDLLKKNVNPEEWIKILGQNKQAIPKKRKNMPEVYIYISPIFSNMIYINISRICCMSQMSYTLALFLHASNVKMDDIS